MLEKVKINIFAISDALHSLLFKKESSFFLSFIIGNLITFLLFRGQVIIFWDQYYPINPLQSLDTLFSVWDRLTFGGVPQGANPSFVPLVILFYIFSFGGVNHVIGQQLTFGLLLTFAYHFTNKFFLILSEYLFSNDFLHKNNHTILIFSKLLSFTYLLNQYSLFSVYRILNTNVTLFAFLPAILYSCLKLINTTFNEEKKIKKYTLVFLIVLLNSVFIAPTFANLAFLLLYYLFFPIFNFILGLNKLKFWGSVKNSLVITILSILFSLWFIFPTYTTVNRSYETARRSGGGYAALEINSKDLNFFSTIIFQNTGGIQSDCTKWPTPCNANTYNNFQSILYFNLLVLFASVYLYIKTKSKIFNQLNIIIFSLVIWIFFASAISSVNITNPLRPLFLLIYKNIDALATAFRDGAHKIGNFQLVAYIISIFTAYLSLSHFLDGSILKKYKIKVWFIALIFVVVNIIPSLFYLASGSLVSEGKNSDGIYIAGGRFNLESEYYKMREIFEKNKIKSTVELPLQANILSYNNTDPISVAPSIIRNASNVPTISNTITDPVFSQIYKMLIYFDSNDKYDELIDTLKVIGIDSITLPKISDLNIGLISNSKLKNYEFYLGKFSNRLDLDKVEDNKRYVVFKIKDARPQFYTVNTPSVIPDSKVFNEYNIKDVGQNAESILKSSFNDKQFNAETNIVKRSDEATSFEILESKIKSISLDTFKNENYGFINFNNTLNINSSELNENLLIVRNRCQDGCSLLLQTTYEDSNGNRERVFLTPLNTLQNESGYSKNSFVNSAYELYRPNSKIVDFNIHIINDKFSKKSIKKLEIDNFGFAAKKDLDYVKVNPSAICQSVDLIKEPRKDYKEIVKYKPVPIREYNKDTTPYLKFKIDSLEGSVNHYFQFTGFDKDGKETSGYIQPTYEDDEFIELDLRDLDFNKIVNLNLHITTSRDSVFGINKSCLKILGYSDFSLDKNRIIDVLISNFGKDKDLKINECAFEKYLFSPAYKVDCKNTSENSILVTNISTSSSWYTRGEFGTLGPAKKSYLNIFNSFEIGKLNDSKIYIGYKTFDYFLIIFSLNMAFIACCGIYVFYVNFINKKDRIQPHLSLPPAQ